MKKMFFNFETIRFIIYAIGLFCLGLLYVYKADATIKDLDKRVEKQEQETRCIKEDNINISEEVIEIKTQTKMIYEMQQESNKDIKQLLARRNK
jgi:hypothetical protein